MILLDTDHVSVLMFDTSERAKRLDAKIRAVGPSLEAVGIPTIEESMRG